MIVNRRGALKVVLGGGLVYAFPRSGFAENVSFRNEGNGYTSYDLANGLRVHCCRCNSRYISAALVLRSSDIMAHGGLAHILEHTSFTGAAGELTARELKQRHKDIIQESNATTAPGTLEWYASFLPKYAPDALNLLAITSLDQKFDVETVASEARIVLQELYQDKYSAEAVLRRRFQSILYGRDHPHGKDTLRMEIAKARTPPQKLAKELQNYAAMIRLPANMDLLLAGDIEPGQMRELADQHFGRYPFAKGPLLQMPRVGATRTYHAMSGKTGDLKRPLCEIRIAWNTDVPVNDPHARTLMALSACANEALFSELREKHGDSYSPEVTYEPDGCSGVFTVTVASSKHPEKVEKRIFSIFDQLKTNLNPSELDRFRERWELKLAKAAESSDTRVETMVSRLIDGCAIDDLDIRSVSHQEVVEAARKYLPTYKGAYVRVNLRGT